MSIVQNKKNIIENDRITIKSFKTGRKLDTFVAIVALSGVIYLGAIGGNQCIAVPLVALPVTSIVQAIIGSYKKIITMNIKLSYYN